MTPLVTPTADPVAVPFRATFLLEPCALSCRVAGHRLGKGYASSGEACAAPGSGAEFLGAHSWGVVLGLTTLLASPKAFPLNLTCTSDGDPSHR